MTRRRRAVRAVALGLLAWLCAGCAFARGGEIPPLIPLPAHIEMQDGRYVVGPGTRLHPRGEDAADVARTFSQLLARTLDLPLAPATVSTPDAGIVFTTDATMVVASPEAYRLTIDASRIEIRAADPHGLFNGAMTLWQLLASAPHAGEGLVLPAMRIDDAPRFAWRGYMLDSARHFHAVDDIKRLLDAMAQHKLNVFHWHLTDDQGWRIEIRKYPRLAEVGGCREAVGDVDPATGAPRRHCGWYTQAQIREIVDYAAQRRITVVPEIDLPGHATAAIAAYPELGVEGRVIPVSNQRGIHANLFNVEEGTFAFLEDVFAEVVALFPSPYIHV
nr:beta-N-acetylhexosaminidase [Luteimonas sp.]